MRVSTPLLTATACLVHKLGHTPLLFANDEERMKDIVTLIRYCYDSPAPERLKKLLAVYSACAMADLWPHPDFKKLVLENTEFATACND